MARDNFCSYCLAWLLLCQVVMGCPNLEIEELSYFCDHNLTSIGDLYRSDFSPNSTVCVRLEANSAETLSYRDTRLSFNTIIRGNNSTVTCANSTGGLGAVYTQFPLRFYNVSQVVIQEIRFQQCMWPVQIEEVKTVFLSFTNWRNFTPGGALDIYNSPIICIQDSSFENGLSEGYKNESFSGNSGGVAIGYSQPYQLQGTTYTPDITISRCSFLDNSARAIKEYRFSVLEVLSRKVYNQRGGAMAFYFGTRNYSGDVHIEDSKFDGNVADDSGGGIYMFLGGSDSAHNVSISNTTFARNHAQDGGGLEITHSNANSIANPNFIRVTNCTFHENWGNFGGGYKNIQLNDQTNANYLVVERTVFSNNTANVGAGIYMQAVVTIVKSTLQRRITMENCMFFNNTGRRGVVFVIGNVVKFKGETRLERSTGPALRVLGTLVVLEGDILFVENRFHPEGFSGALYLSSFGQIILKSNTNIQFLNNTGSEGACIVARGQLIAAAFTQQLYNPQCFLQYEYPTMPPYLWNVNITFEGNRATVGPAVLFSDAEICLWKNSTRPFFSTLNHFLDTWKFLHMGTNYVNDRPLEPKFYIQTGISNLSLKSDNITAYPGEKVKVEATALDQFNHTTSGFIGISSSAMDVNFEPSIVPISPLEEGIEFQYSGVASDGVESTVILNPFFISDNSNMNLTLRHSQCPAGFVLNSAETCECRVTDVVIFCMDDDRGLLLADGLWGASKCQQLAYYPCPPGYCDCNSRRNDTDEISQFDGGCKLHRNVENDMLCNTYRKGVLCGQCEPPTGVGLLTNNCQKHQGSLPHFWLFPLYVAALVVTLVLLVKLGVHLPTILRGFIFYIQIAPIAVAYFPDGFRPAREQMACFSSMLALYVPYDFTFHERMTSLESYGLKYTAPIIALIVVPIAARVRHHRFKYWHGIWTIVLLMYVMSVETSTSLLFCPTLNVKNCPEVERVWFFDGSVQCYSGWHIPLAILAIVCHLAQALLVLLVAAVIYYKTLRKRYAKFEQLERFSIVVTYGIKHEYKWWPIVELACRYIFVTSVVLSPGHVVVPLVLAIIVFVMQTMIHPYRNKVANYMESLLFLWLVCFLGLGSTTELQSGSHGKWPDALLYIPLACAFVVMAVHCVLLTRKALLPHSEAIKRKLKMTSKDPVGKLRRTFTVSYSARKKRHLYLNQHMDPGVTGTVVSLDDDNPAEETAQETSGSYVSGHVDIHTS